MEEQYIEYNSLIALEFIVLRAKSYVYILEDEEKIKAKGIREHVLKTITT